MQISRKQRPWKAFFGSRLFGALGVALVVLAITVVQLWLPFENDGSGLTILTNLQEKSLNSSLAVIDGSPKFEEVGQQLQTESSEKSHADQQQNPPATDTNQQHHMKGHDTKRKKIWSAGRSDRSGATIQDMLMCHAYAFHQGADYGGACVRDWGLPQFEGKRQIHEALLEAIGLSRVLKFDCPPKKGEGHLTGRNHYISNDTAIFTSDYIQHLQSLVDYPTMESADSRRRISVHIRRGDITPCRPRTRGYPRYLPNQHFLGLIERYNPQNDSHVVIYSESESFEEFDEFYAKGYEVVLDGSIGKVWQGIISSQVVILSRSSFSLVPALMTKGKVIFTPFWHAPLPHWEVVDEAFLNATHLDFRRLKETCPKKKNKQK